MKLHLILITPVLLILSYSSFSQEYSYTHYDVKDGLAGSKTRVIVRLPGYDLFLQKNSI